MYGKTSVTLSGDELLAMKTALRMEIDTTAGFLKDGDAYGVWTAQLERLESAYKKIERALRRV